MTFDALVVKCREGGRTVNVCVVHAVGVNRAGFRESLGLDVVTAEDGAAWLAFLRSLVARGLSGVRLATSDAHPGLVDAIAATLPGSAWQRCRTHAMRNLLTRVPKSAQSFVATMVRTIFAQPDAATVYEQHRRIVDQLETRFPEAAALLEEAAPDLLADVLDEPGREHRAGYLPGLGPRIDPRPALRRLFRQALPQWHCCLWRRDESQRRVPAPACQAQPAELGHQHPRPGIFTSSPQLPVSAQLRPNDDCAHRRPAEAEHLPAELAASRFRIDIENERSAPSNSSARGALPAPDLANNARTPLPDRPAAIKHVAFPPKRDSNAPDTSRSLRPLYRRTPPLE